MPKTARERAREELTREILDVARKHLVADGAERLSLRAIARELDMVSSAIYRYFPSRDDLLTALVIEAYDAIGEHVEHADRQVRRRHDYLRRWRATCTAVREWAKANPQQYALIYGTPIVGYRAPRSTVGPASRVPLALIGIVRDCVDEDRLRPVENVLPVPRAAKAQLDMLADTVDVARVPTAALGAFVNAWTQVYGMVSMELFGHLEGVFDDKASLFDYCVDRMARQIGLSGP